MNNSPPKLKCFPCPYCKGQGGEKEVICDDGSGPYYECGYCEGEGMIVIGGEIHLRRKKEKKEYEDEFDVSMG